MALFPEIEHKVYNYTFLLNTFTALHFAQRTEADCDEALMHRLEEFLQDSFQAPNTRPPYPSQEIFLQRGDGQVDFLLTDRHAMVRVGRKVYRTFGASLLPEASKLRRFVFDVLQLNSVSRIEVRKISLFPMDVPGISPIAKNVTPLLSQILSQNVMSLMKVGEVSEIEGSVAPFTHHVMTDVASGYRYDILLGLMLDPARGINACNAILDVTCSYGNNDGISSDDIERRQVDMNKTVYDFYHWAVRDHVIDVMQRKEENNESGTNQ